MQDNLRCLPGDTDTHEPARTVSLREKGGPGTTTRLVALLSSVRSNL